MTPFSGVPLPSILGIKSGAKVSVINPPRSFVQRLNPLPDGVEFLVTAQSGLDLILFFTSDSQELVQRLPALSRALNLQGSLWVFWPSGPDLKTVLSEEFVRHAALDIGLVDNKMCLVDATWSGLRLVRRPRGRVDKPDPERKLTVAQA